MTPDEIKNLRQRLKLTQEALAHEVETTGPTVNRWEKGHAKPTRRFVSVMRAMITELEKNGN